MMFFFFYDTSFAEVMKVSRIKRTRGRWIELFYSFLPRMFHGRLKEETKFQKDNLQLRAVPGVYEREHGATSLNHDAAHTR